MDMLRLCRSDNMGVRDIIPGLMLRLGKDQECYDFAKWWSIIDEKSDYDWGDANLPYLDIRNADAFEHVGYLCRRYIDVSQVVAVVLLKIRLLLDLNTLQSLFIRTQARSSDEIRSIVQQPFEARSSIVASMDHGWKLQDHSERIKMIASQIKSLIPAVNETNRHFWKKLVDGKKADPPGPYALGSPEHGESGLLYSHMSWIETPGAIELLKEMLCDRHCQLIAL